MKHCLAVLPLILVSAFHVCSQEPLDVNQTVTQTVAGERDCDKADWQFATQVETQGRLGADTLPMQSCRAVSLLWLPSAKIVQLTGWEHTDVFVCVTLIRANDSLPLRVIRVHGGLSADKNREDDEGYKSIFNELLRASNYKPSENQMLDLAGLYMFMVGHPPDESPRKLIDLLSMNDVEGMVASKHGWTTVNIHERTSPPLEGAHGEWVLRFHKMKGHLRLASVFPERH